MQYRNGEPQPVSSTPETLVRMARAVGADAGDLLEAFDYSREIAANIPEVVAERAANEAAPEPPARMLDISALDEQEEQLIRTFLLGIQAGKSGRIE